jgi:hypothetical protein
MYSFYRWLDDLLIYLVVVAGWYCVRYGNAFFYWWYNVVGILYYVTYSRMWTPLIKSVNECFPHTLCGF